MGLLTDTLDCQQKAQSVIDAGGSQALAVAEFRACVTAKGYTYSPTDTNLQDFLHTVVGFFTAGIADQTNGISGSTTSGAQSAIDSTGSALAQSTSSITGAINTQAQQTQGLLSKIETGITNSLGKLDQIVSSAQNSTVFQVLQELQNLSGAAHSTQALLEQDVQNGLQGLLRLPTDLSNAFGSFDGIFSRAIHEQNAYTDARYQNWILPQMLKSGSVPIGKLTEVFGSFDQDLSGSPVFGALDSLREYMGNRQFACEDLTAPGTTKTFEGGTPEQLAEAATAWLEKVKNPKHWWESFASDLWTVMVAFETVSAELISVTHRAEQAARRNVPDAVLDPATTIEALRRGLLSHDSACYELASNGLDPTRQKILYDVAQFLFSPRDVVELRARNLITNDEFSTLMDQNNLDAAQSGALLQLMEVLPGVPDAVRAYLRGIIDETDYQRYNLANKVPAATQAVLEKLTIPAPNARIATRLMGRAQSRDQGFLPITLRETPSDALRQQYTENLLSQGEADQDWLAHWAVPPPEWWIEAVFRGLVDKQTAYDAFQSENVPRELWDTLFGVAEELPPVWLVPDVVASGVWKKEQAVPTLMKLGFSEENATVLYEYGLSKSKATKSQTAQNLQGLSLSASRTLYDDSAIDAATYKDLLLAHGLGDEAATLTVELADIENAQKARKDFVAYLVNQVSLGALSKADALSELAKQGFTEAETVAAALKIERATAANTKLPSKAELDKFLTAGYIDVGIWRTTMDQIGYHEPWQSIYLTELGVLPSAAS